MGKGREEGGGVVSQWGASFLSGGAPWGRHRFWWRVFKKYCRMGSAPPPMSPRYGKPCLICIWGLVQNILVILHNRKAVYKILMHSYWSTGVHFWYPDDKIFLGRTKHVNKITKNILIAKVWRKHRYHEGMCSSKLRTNRKTMIFTIKNWYARYTNILPHIQQ